MAGCSTAKYELRPESQAVQVVIGPEAVKNCEPKGILIGSIGHWYSYLFLANTTMMRGALTDLRNQAAEIGADSLLLPNSPYYFVTSVTMMAQAFQCQKTNSHD